VFTFPKRRQIEFVGKSADIISIDSELYLKPKKPAFNVRFFIRRIFIDDVLNKAAPLTPQSKTQR
jgi:hypothetical protein